jgi:hypothetical protein
MGDGHLGYITNLSKKSKKKSIVDDAKALVLLPRAITTLTN